MVDGVHRIYKISKDGKPVTEDVGNRLKIRIVGWQASEDALQMMVLRPRRLLICPF